MNKGLILCLAAGLWASDDPEQKARIEGIRAYAKQGPAAIANIEPYLEDRDPEVRWEAVKAIADLGTRRSLAPLMRATRDNRPEIQIRACDGLVNFYLPGYLRSGWTEPLRRAAAVLQRRFTDTNTDVIAPHVEVSPEVIQTLGALVTAGSSMESRANAARALGILRGRPALPALYEALRSKDSLLLYEALIAIQKIRDLESGPRIQFLLRDLDDKVQIAAIETTGILRNRQSIPDLQDLVEHGRKDKVRRAALAALAMIPDASNRELFRKHFLERDDQLRAAAAEGLGRLGHAEDLPLLEQAFEQERKMRPRLSIAFALVMLGKREWSEFSPLAYLINALNSGLYADYAQPLLVEAARRKETLEQIHLAIASEKATRQEKIRLADVLAQSGDAQSVTVLEKLASAPDAELGHAATRAIQAIKASRLESR